MNFLFKKKFVDNSLMENIADKFQIEGLAVSENEFDVIYILSKKSPISGKKVKRKKDKLIF